MQKQQDLLRQAGGDESLISEMRSNVRSNSLIYQMASEELRRYGDAQSFAVEEDGGVGSKRLREDLPDMVEASHVLVKNMKSATLLKQEYIEKMQEETLQIEKQTYHIERQARVRTKELEDKLTLNSKEREAVLDFEKKRQDGEAQHLDTIYTKKLHYELQLKKLTSNKSPEPELADEIEKPKKEPVVTLKTVGLEHSLKPSDMTMQAWKTVLQKAGRKAVAELNFHGHVLEDGYNVKAYHTTEKEAIKAIIEEEVLRHMADGHPPIRVIQRPINLNINLNGRGSGGGGSSAASK